MGFLLGELHNEVAYVLSLIFVDLRAVRGVTLLRSPFPCTRHSLPEPPYVLADVLRTLVCLFRVLREELIN